MIRFHATNIKEAEEIKKYFPKSKIFVANNFPGDISKNILPIEKIDGRYAMQFESEFEYMPDLLMFATIQALEGSEIAESFIVEVEKCGTKDIVTELSATDLDQAKFKARIAIVDDEELLVRVLVEPLTDLGVDRIHLHAHVRSRHHRLELLLTGCRIGHGVRHGVADRLPLVRTGGALGELPLVVQQAGINCITMIL